MIKTFSELKNLRKDNFQKLSNTLQKMASGQFQDDNEGYWQPTVDKAGNGYAVIRFLPAPAIDGDDAVAFIRLWDHGFKGPGGWYIERSLTTLNKPDPAAEYNSKLWAQGEGSEGRRRVSGTGRDNPGTKRRLHFIANVYIVKDPGKPENEGKVFLFKYGKKIHNKINDAIHPPFEGDEPLDAFNLWGDEKEEGKTIWGGANFKLKIRRVEGQRNYDSSEWDTKGPLFTDDDKLEAIWRSERSLKEIVDPSNFKTYNELKERLARVLGVDEGPSMLGVNRDDYQQASVETPPWEKQREDTVVGDPVVEEEDDDSTYFERLKALANS